MGKAAIETEILWFRRRCQVNSRELGVCQGYLFRKGDGVFGGALNIGAKLHLQADAEQHITSRINVNSIFKTEAKKREYSIHVTSHPLFSVVPLLSIRHLCCPMEDRERSALLDDCDSLSRLCC